MHFAPLKLQPYGAIQICLLLSLYYYKRLIYCDNQQIYSIINKRISLTSVFNICNQL